MSPAIPGEILSIHGADPLMRVARVNFGGVIKEIQLVYTPNAAIGDYVLAHVGFAVAIVDEGEAKRAFAYLEEIDELEEEEAEEER